MKSKFQIIRIKKFAKKIKKENLSWDFNISALHKNPSHKALCVKPTV